MKIPKPKKGYITIRDVVHHQNNNLIFLDPCVQRNACWTTHRMIRYIESIIKNGDPGNLLWGDFTDEYAEVDGYYGNLKAEGFVALSIDGNNKSVAVTAFVNDEFVIEFQESDGKYKKYFHELSSDAQSAFLDCEFGHSVHTNASKTKRAELFNDVNDGIPITSQDKRNSLGGFYGSDDHGDMRGFAAKMTELVRPLTILSPKGSFNVDPTTTDPSQGRYIDQVIFSLHLFMMEPDMSAKEDRLMAKWKVGEDQYSDRAKLWNKTKTCFRKTIAEVRKLQESGFVKIQSPKSLLVDTHLCYGLLLQDNVQIDLNKFIPYVVKKHIEMKDNLVEIKIKENVTTTYNELVKTFDPSHRKIRNRILQEYIIEPYKQAENLGKRVDRRVKLDCPILRNRLKALQGSKCAYTGAHIEHISDLGRWTVDHVEPITVGGLDVEENMVLCCSAANDNKKGKKLGKGPGEWNPDEYMKSLVA
jgi:5-methylcytosine-specific restriction endonuclease McrA